MNLQAIVAPIIAAVNPMLPVTVRISIGEAAISADGLAAPLYATPGAFTGSIAGTTLTVSAIASGRPLAGQAIAGTGVEPGTSITGVLSVDDEGLGTYEVSIDQDVASTSMSAELALLAQVQALSGRDLRQTEGMNLQGTLSAIYVNGPLDGVVRSALKGGDLIVFPDGRVWLVSVVLEPWNTTAGWTKVACVLQNDGS